MKQRQFLALLLAASISAPCMAYTTNEIRNILIQGGYPQAQITPQLLSRLSRSEPEATELFLAPYKTENKAKRAQMLQHPDFATAARLMLLRFQEAQKICKEVKPDAYKADKTFGIFSTDYVTPVLNVIDLLNIDGFNVASLRSLDLNPAEDTQLRQALVKKYNPEKGAANEAEVAAVLANIYDNFGGLVRAKYNVSEEGNKVSFYLKDSSYTPRKASFADGQLIFYEGASTADDLLPARKRLREYSDDYPDKVRRQLAATCPDQQLLDFIFQTPLEPKRVMEGDRQVLLYQDGTRITGLSGGDAKFADDFKRNNTDGLLSWFIAYKDLHPEGGNSQQTPLQLVTANATYTLNQGEFEPLLQAMDTVELMEYQAQKQREETIRAEEANYSSTGYMTVTGIEFCDTDKDNNLRTAYGDKLYDIDMRYLSARINVQPHTSVDRQVELKMKITKPDGSVERNSENSPEGFTYTRTVTLSPNSSSIYIGGWGNADNSTYKAGKYNWEIWHGNNKLYTGTCNIAAKPKKAKIVRHWIEYNVYDNNGNKGMKVHVEVNSEAMKGDKLKYVVKFFRANGTTPAYYNGSQLSHTSTLESTYDYSRWEDQWISFPNTTMYKTLNQKSGTLKFDIELQNASGRVLDAVRGCSVSWD